MQLLLSASQLQLEQISRSPAHSLSSTSMRRQLLFAAAAIVAVSLGLIFIRRISFIEPQWPAATEHQTPNHVSVNASDSATARAATEQQVPNHVSVNASNDAAVNFTDVSMAATNSGNRIGNAKDGFTLQPTERRAPKIVLGWTPMYQSSIWWWLTTVDDYAVELVGADCVFTTDRSYLSSADLVVFHGCFQPHDSFAYPDYRRPSQRWVYVMSEAPTSRYCTNKFVPADGLFNLTATYKRDSDLVFSYSPGFVRRNESTTDTIGPKLIRNKTKMAFWYMSDCSSEWSSHRSEYVKALRRYMPVDVYGTCRKFFPDSVAPPCPKSSDDSMDRCFLQQSKQYKFYLSFENAHCRDYITEKLFKVLRPESDVVPVALGATIDDYAAVAPPDSFIHVSNFSSPKDLAAYLRYLDEHDDAYLAYHRWRERFVMRPIPGKNSIDQHPPSQLRQLCAAAHHPPPSRVWTDLVSWFSIERDCKVVKDICLVYGICEEKRQ